MFATTTFWFLVAFILFFVFFGRMIWVALRGSLDDRAVRIEEDIKEAVRLKDEAQATLNDIKSRHQQAEKHAQAIIEHARLEAERLRSEANRELEEFLKHREALVEQRIQYAEAEAVKDIRNSAVKLAIAACDEILAKVVTAESDNKIVEKAIKNIAS